MSMARGCKACQVLHQSSCMTRGRWERRRGSAALLHTHTHTHTHTCVHGRQAWDKPCASSLISGKTPCPARSVPAQTNVSCTRMAAGHCTGTASCTWRWRCTASAPLPPPQTTCHAICSVCTANHLPHHTRRVRTWGVCAVVAVHGGAWVVAGVKEQLAPC